jgi:predicted transcriptional regulator
MGINEIAKVKFASQADPQLLDELKAIAKAEGRQLQALMEEAFKDFVEKKRGSQMRPTVRAALERTLRERDWLYKQLAK